MALKLVSQAFQNGERIPTKYTADGTDLSPPLEWHGEPAGTQSFALICDDPDAPRGTWTHWVAFNLSPSLHVLPEGTPLQATLFDGASQGTNDSENRVTAARPPKGPAHRYFFKLYAVDQILQVKAGASRTQLLHSLQGHILEEAELVGTYGRT